MEKYQWVPRYSSLESTKLLLRSSLRRRHVTCLYLISQVLGRGYINCLELVRIIFSFFLIFQVSINMSFRNAAESARWLLCSRFWLLNSKEDASIPHVLPVFCSSLLGILSDDERSVVGCYVLLSPAAWYRKSAQPNFMFCDGDRVAQHRRDPWKGGGVG